MDSWVEHQQFLLSMSLLFYLQFVMSTLICISLNFLLYIEKTTIPCCFKMHWIRSWFHWGKSSTHWTLLDSEQAFSFLKETFFRINMSTQSKELFVFLFFPFYFFQKYLSRYMSNVCVLRLKFKPQKKWNANTSSNILGGGNRQTEKNPHNSTIFVSSFCPIFQQLNLGLNS